MHKTQTLVTLLVALLLSLAGQDAWAQDNNLARIYEVKAQSGHAAELEAAIQAHAAWRKEQGDPWYWQVFQVVNGDNLGNIFIRSGDHTWGDFDAYDGGFGQQGSAHWQANVMSHVESITSMITASHADYHQLPEDMSVFNLFSVTFYHVKPGYGDDFMEAVGLFHDAVKKTDWPVHYAWVSTVNGGEGPANILVLPYENWAAMAGPEKSLGAMMNEVYGEYASNAFEQFGSSHYATESSILLFRPDLSVLPNM